VLPEAPVSLVTAVLAQQEAPLTTFVTLLVKEEERQLEQSKEEAGFKDNVTNETSCKR